jgi:hypothetical protein
MSTSCNLFFLNPLTAIFLSGVATQITFIVYFNNSHLTGKSNVILSNSHRRIKIWQQLFQDYCNEYYTKYSEAYEKEEFHSKNNFHPFLAHTNLLIKYSMIILEVCKVQNIGNATNINIQKWFLLISDIINSKIWTHHIPIQNRNTLYSLVEKHDNMKDNDVGCGTKKDFIEFNCVALFIRSALIVNIHKTLFCTTTFNSWEHCNSCLLSKYINIHDYLKDFSLENKPIYFLSEFPIINHLPCMEIYKMWDDSAQKSLSIPFNEIFTFILQLLSGKMMTLHYHQRNQFNLPTMNEKANIINFNKFCSMANISMKKKLNEVRNNEKQKKHQMLKMQKFNDNNYYHNEYYVDGKNFFSLIFGTNFYSSQIYDDSKSSPNSRGMCQINRSNINNTTNSARLSIVSHQHTNNMKQNSQKHEDTKSFPNSRGMCQKNRSNINNTKSSAGLLNLVSYQHTNNMKQIDYTKHNEDDNTKAAKEQFQNEIIAMSSQMFCKNKDDHTDLQEVNDDMLNHGSLFVRSSQRRQLLESSNDKTQKSRKYLIDEDLTFQQELESIKIVSSRKGRASNLDGAIKVNQSFQHDMSTTESNECTKYISNNIPSCTKYISNNIPSSCISKTFLNSKALKKRKTSFLRNN